MRSVLTILVLTFLIAISIQAQTADPFAAEFQVNSYTTSYQLAPQVAVDALGNFVVVWTSDGSDGQDTNFMSVQARRYDANGAPVGGQFQVNAFSTGNQQGPALAMSNSGNFVVVWHSHGSYGGDTSNSSIQAQRYDATGAPVGGQFQVNSYTTGNQLVPAVAADAPGNFVVVWQSNGSYDTDTSSYSIQAQRYDTTGAPVGGQFQVNSYTTDYQSAAAVAADATGDFAVVWVSRGSYGADSSYDSIQAQRYDATGAPVGGQFQVNSYTTGRQLRPAVAADVFGKFVVVWDSGGSDGTDASAISVQAQRYNVLGGPVGSEFQVNSYTTYSQGGVAVASDALGNSFVVAWGSMGSYGTDTSFGSVQAQRYEDTGAAVGGEFQLNSYTTGSQVGPAVAVDFVGNIVAVWSSDGSGSSDTSSTSIQGKYYSTNAIFGDGFEFGDISAWSSTQ